MWTCCCTIPGFAPGSLWPVFNYKQRPESDELPNGIDSCQDRGERPGHEGRCCQLGGGFQQFSGSEGPNEDGQSFCSHGVPNSNRGGELPSDIAVVTVVITVFV